MPTTLNAAFFDAVRPLFGGKLKQSQVDGLTLIAKTWDQYGDGDADKLAYILATAFHESAQTMQAIREYGKGKGKKYGKIDQTGKAPYGRGLVQLTWRENYVKADEKLHLGGALAADYDLALEPLISARVLIMGMMEGWFTSKKLSDYIGGGKVDFKNARRVVNGTDKADHIAVLAGSFQRALLAVQSSPAPNPSPDTKQPPTGFLGALLAILKFILSLFKRKP